MSDWRDRLSVPDEKVTTFLLSLSHPKGGPRARVFLDGGFSIEDPGELATKIVAHALSGELVRTVAGEFGLKFVVEGTLAMPNGSDRLLRSIWIERTPGGPVLLVTAYPLRTRR